MAAARERIEVLEDAVQKRENGAAALAAAAECEGARQCIGELRAQIAVRWVDCKCEGRLRHALVGCAACLSP